MFKKSGSITLWHTLLVSHGGFYYTHTHTHAEAHKHWHVARKCLGKSVKCLLFFSEFQITKITKQVKNGNERTWRREVSDTWNHLAVQLKNNSIGREAICMKTGSILYEFRAFESSISLLKCNMNGTQTSAQHSAKLAHLEGLNKSLLWKNKDSNADNITLWVAH